MEYYSAIKKSEIMPFVAPWMDLECPTEWSNLDREKNTLSYGLYVESEKKYKWTYLQNRNRLKGLEKELMVIQGKG